MSLKPFMPNLAAIQFRHIFTRECFNCFLSFDNEHKPYQVKCGHSVCSECKDDLTNTSFYCFKCTVIVPNAKDAIANKSFWQQLVRLETEDQLNKFIKEKEERVKGDPELKLGKYLLNKSAQLCWLKVLQNELANKLSEYNKYGNVAEEYQTMVKAFSDEQKQFGPKEALMRLSEKIGTIEDKLKKLTTIENLYESVDIEKKYFEIFKTVQIRYDNKVFSSLLDDGYKVYIFFECEGKEKFSAKCTKDEIGIHLHRYEKDVLYNDIFYFWSTNMRPISLGKAKYFFLNIMANVEYKNSRINKIRRIYISLREEYCDQNIIDFFTGVHGNFRGLEMQTNGKYVMATLSNRYCCIRDDTQWEEDRVGLVTLQSKENGSILRITLQTSPKPDRVRNAIGELVAGLNYLQKAKNIIIKDHGICFDTQ